MSQIALRTAGEARVPRTSSGRLHLWSRTVNSLNSINPTASLSNRGRPTTGPNTWFKNSREEIIDDHTVPHSHDPVRKPPTRPLPRPRAARPRLRVFVVTCVHHNIPVACSVRASSALMPSPSPRPTPSLRESPTPGTRGSSASSRLCRTSPRGRPCVWASWARRWCRRFESRSG